MVERTEEKLLGAFPTSGANLDRREALGDFPEPRPSQIVPDCYVTWCWTKESIAAIENVPLTRSQLHAGHDGPPLRRGQSSPGDSKGPPKTRNLRERKHANETFRRNSQYAWSVLLSLGFLDGNVQLVRNESLQRGVRPCAER
jgi:hypothetical protein